MDGKQGAEKPVSALRFSDQTSLFICLRILSEVGKHSRHIHFCHFSNQRSCNHCQQFIHTNCWGLCLNHKKYFLITYFLKKSFFWTNLRTKTLFSAKTRFPSLNSVIKTECLQILKGLPLPFCVPSGTGKQCVLSPPLPGLLLPLEFEYLFPSWAPDRLWLTCEETTPRFLSGSQKLLPPI